MKKFFKTHVKLCIAVLALAMVTVGGTLALMAVSSNTVTNQFTAANIDTEIEETVGTQNTKQVSITNKGSSDAYVRARILVSGVENGQVQIVDSVPSELTGENAEKVFLVMGEGYGGEKPWNWQKDRDTSQYTDDFYYYLDVLKPRQKSTELLSKVVFGEALENNQEFLEGFSITVSHESVLAINQPQAITLDVVKGAFSAAVPTETPAADPQG